MSTVVFPLFTQLNSLHADLATSLQLLEITKIQGLDSEPVATSSTRVQSEELHLFCMLLRSILKACKGLFLGIFGIFHPTPFTG